jgi:hypothetical protein
LFFDSSVQKVLSEGNVLNLFIKYIKYPRTYHFPWSPSVGKDDKIMKNYDVFIGKRVIVSIKMDGENTTMYNNYIHARSIDSGNHLSRNWVKKFHAEKGYNIPEGYRICGENLYAQHAIHYDNLEEYFLLFSVWNEKNQCLSWDETKEWANLLEMKIVPVIYDGIWDENLIKNIYQSKYNEDECEGYVVRLANMFDYNRFRYSCAKYVRSGHCGTHGHWMKNMVIPNKVKEN